MALSAGALTTVQAVRNMLLGKDTIPPTEHDPLFEFLVEAVSDRIERFCGRTFAKATYTEFYIGHGRQWLLLKNRPIVTVTYVKQDTVTVASSDYTILVESGMLFRESGWPGGALEHGVLALGDPHPFAGKYNLEVQYDAGYITPNQAGTRTLPYDLELAAARAVVEEYKLRDKQGVAQETHEGMSLMLGRWPEDLQALLNYYRDVK